MAQNVLLTGASGYLGGTILNRLNNAGLNAYKLFALVRTSTQADAVKKYGATPLQFNVHDPREVRFNIMKHQINIVFYMIDAVGSDGQMNCIRALAELKKHIQHDVHFLHTSGAKLFSSHAGAPPSEIFDNQPDLFDIQRSWNAPLPVFQRGAATNGKLIEEGERSGVSIYIFVPCIVYGRGEGFGNQISIQTVAIYKAAKALRKVYRVNDDKTIWPVCHVSETSELYLAILRKILAKEKLGHGRDGYYLASSGKVKWDDIYAGMASAMYTRGLVDDAKVETADDSVLEEMGRALGAPKEMVAPQLSGLCLLTAKHGEEIGWKSHYAPEHIMDSLDAEVALIQENLR